MLRKPLKRVGSSLKKEKGKRTKKITKDNTPLGSEKLKNRSEKELEALVLGGDDDIIKELNETNKEIDDDDIDDDDIGSSQNKTQKRPAWEDEDDNQGSIQFTKDRRFTGIKHGEETKITKSEYSQRLKSQFEKVSSTPNWAKLPSERDKNSDDEDSDVEDILHSTGTYLKASASLPKGVLQIKQCTDINKDSPLKSRIKALEFHPSAQVALAGGLSNTLTLFQVDGKTNPKIQSIFLENYPIFSAHFTRDGEQVVIGSKHKCVKYFDMIAGKIVNIPMKWLEDATTMNFEVSPDGKYLVVLGKYGRMHFISAKSKEWIFTLTMNGSVSSVAFTSDGRKMFSHGDDGQVYVWDLQTRDCTHRFMDEGCTQGTSISVSGNDQYIACGSYSGVVNLYETQTCLSTFEPAPLKAIMNLTSTCNKTKFNPTSEILAISSSHEERAVKLVHMPSQSVYSNFPDPMDASLRIPTCIDFSCNSGYMSLGTHKGKALLYRLKHYGNY